jgi:hypothetical protein
MPRYVIERDIPGAGRLSERELQAISRKALDVMRQLGPDIQWVHTYVGNDRTYCVYYAKYETIVREHARLSESR